jgi:succinate dehydrogenase/fumarate reductase flavoprotein subunit
MDDAGKRSEMKWPYLIRYEEETEVASDILSIGGGVARCIAAIAAAKGGLTVILLVKKAATFRSGADGPGLSRTTRAMASTPDCLNVRGPFG